MTARFTDQKALVFAYTDLLDQGIPAHAMRAAFDEVPGANDLAGVRHGRLTGLLALLRAGKVRQQAPKKRTEPKAQGQSMGGLLHVDADGREQAASQVILHHFGVVIS